MKKSDLPPKDFEDGRGFMQNYQFLGRKLKNLDESRKKSKKTKLGMEVLTECDRIEV